MHVVAGQLLCLTVKFCPGQGWTEQVHHVQPKRQRMQTSVRTMCSAAAISLKMLECEAHVCFLQMAIAGANALRATMAM